MNDVKALIDEVKSAPSPQAKTAKQLLRAAMSVRLTADDPQVQAMQQMVDALAERAKPEVDDLTPNDVLHYAVNACERWGRLVRVTSSSPSAPKRLEGIIPSARRTLEAYCEATLAALRELDFELPVSTATTAKEILAEAMSVLPRVDHKNPIDQLLAGVVEMMVQRSKDGIAALSPVQVVCSAADGCHRMASGIQLAARDQDKAFAAVARQGLSLYCQAYLAALRELGA